MTGRPELPADALGTSGRSSLLPCGGLLARLPVGTTRPPLVPLPLVGVLLPVVGVLLPVSGVLDLPPVAVVGTAPLFWRVFPFVSQTSNFLEPQSYHMIDDNIDN